MYKTFVMTFKDAPSERLKNAKKLAKKMKGEVFIGGTDTFKNFFSIIELCYKDKKGLLLLEDDVTSLAKKKIFKTIKSNPDKTINFNYKTQHGEVPFINFIMLQCCYFPFKYVEIMHKARNIAMLQCRFYYATRQHDKYPAVVLAGDTFLSVDGEIVTPFKSSMGHT